MWTRTRNGWCETFFDGSLLRLDRDGGDSTFGPGGGGVRAEDKGEGGLGEGGGRRV